MMVEEALMGDPFSFNEAYFHEDSWRRKGWIEAIKKEILNMEKCKVWYLIDKIEIKEERILIGNKRIFVQKRDGTFRARLVA
jgi:hypothetical protein